MSPRERITGLLSPLLEIVMRQRLGVKFVLHLAIFFLAYSLAFLVRFDFAVPSDYVAVMWMTIPVVLGAKALGFLAFGLFHGWWREVSIRDIFPIAAGCTLGSLFLAGAISAMWGANTVPRSIFFLDWASTLMIVLGVRYIVLAGREVLGRNRRGDDRRVLIVGAGAAGQM